MNESKQSELIQKLKNSPVKILFEYRTAAIIISRFIDFTAISIILFMFIFPEYFILIFGSILIYIFALMSKNIKDILIVIRESIISKTDK